VQISWVKVVFYKINLVRVEVLNFLVKHIRCPCSLFLKRRVSRLSCRLNRFYRLGFLGRWLNWFWLFCLRCIQFGIRFRGCLWLYWLLFFNNFRLLNWLLFYLRFLWNITFIQRLFLSRFGLFFNFSWNCCLLLRLNCWFWLSCLLFFFFWDDFWILFCWLWICFRINLNLWLNFLDLLWQVFLNLILFLRFYYLLYLYFFIFSPVILVSLNFMVIKF